MWRRLGSLVLVGAVVLGGALRTPAEAADKDSSQDKGKVAGILFEKKENWITVKADGEKEPVKYVLPENADRKLSESLKTVFNASRVQLTYRKDGDERQLVSIRRQVLKEAGTISGLVVKVHDDFWVEVKPRNGPADAFAPGANFQDKAFMERLKGLQPGDAITIRYYTDFERHRIQTLRIDKRAE